MKELANSLLELFVEKYVYCLFDCCVSFREDLMNIARTTLSSKILSQHKDFFSNLAVDAVLR